MLPKGEPINHDQQAYFALRLHLYPQNAKISAQRNSAKT